MLESRAREIQITDVRRPIFLSFLEYLYSDYIDVSVDVAMELFVAADRVRLHACIRSCLALVHSILIAVFFVWLASCRFVSNAVWCRSIKAHMREPNARFFVH